MFEAFNSITIQEAEAIALSVASLLLIVWIINQLKKLLR